MNIYDMQNFLDWLLSEDRADVHFVAWGTDGTVTVLDNGIRYTYQIDAASVDPLLRQAKFAPGKALHAIKKRVQLGAARQLSPPPERVNPVNCPTCKDSCPQCGTPEPHYHPGIECPGCGSIS